MEIFKSRNALSEALNLHRLQQHSIGFVPTMGFLHSGHKSLILGSKHDCDITVVSIFVNPSQFNDKTDFENYPSDIERDTLLLKNLGVDYAFVPDSDEIYPPDALGKLVLDLEPLTNCYEGKSRPGHFSGVLIVLLKLFNIVGPCKAYFGKKDLQQLAIVTEFVKQAFFPVEIVACETIREDSHLALSSRNVRLSAREREIAESFAMSLVEARELLRNKELGESNIESFVKSKINGQEVSIDYADLVNRMSFTKTCVEDRNANIIAAINFPGVRLIDNVDLYGDQG